MANNPKKVKDPTEVALSAIQEALNIADAPTANLEPDRKGYSRNETMTPAADERLTPGFDLGEQADADRSETQAAARRAANDDRETIGNLLHAIQKSRPGRNAYTLASVVSVLWILGVGGLTFAFMPSHVTLVRATLAGWRGRRATFAGCPPIRAAISSSTLRYRVPLRPMAARRISSRRPSTAREPCWTMQHEVARSACWS